MKAFKEGMRDGIPIGLGYLAVAFSLGIVARNIGMNAFQGFLVSFLCIASAGEYAAFTVIASGASYLEMVLMMLVANARYVLMSCALSQRFAPDESFGHRIGVSALITDELFGIAVGREGYIKPAYTYGAALIAVPLWALGTSLGIIMGNVLPEIVVSALSVAIYGMFLAIIIPPARNSRVIAGFIILSFLLSYLCSRVKALEAIPSGFVIIILTVVLSSAAALLFPRKEEEEDHA